MRLLPLSMIPSALFIYLRARARIFLRRIPREPNVYKCAVRCARADDRARIKSH